MTDSLEAWKEPQHWTEMRERLKDDGVIECKICGKDVDVGDSSTIYGAIEELVVTHGREKHPDRFTSSIEDVPDWFRKIHGHSV